MDDMEEMASDEKEMNNSTSSHFDDLLAAYDMQHLADNMAAVETTHRAGTTARTEEHAEGKDGDDLKTLNPNEGEDDADHAADKRVKTNDKPLQFSSLKTRRDRRKRLPNKSILRPSFSQRFQSPPRTTNCVSVSNESDVVTAAKETSCATHNTGVMEQIKSSVLPKYSCSTAPPSHFNVSSYVCPDCSDRFCLESSFAQHVQRRSVYISFFCHFCCKLLTFYNRCALLGHARIHHQRHQACDVSNATLAPLDKELLVCVQEVKISAHIRSESRTEVETQSRKRKASPVVTIMVPKSEAKVVYTTTTSGKINSSSAAVCHTCSECCQTFKTPKDVAQHFGENREAPPATDSECPQCHMICTSRCSLASHRRMHDKRKPYVCPECGEKVSDLWQEFKNHVTDVCLHHSRTLGFRCPVCAVLSVNPEQLKSHVAADHSLVLYKCQRCPRAFKSGKALDSHRRQTHNDLSITQYVTVQRCSVCDAVFHQQTALSKHLESHFQEIFAAAKYVFRCLECGHLSESKTDLSEHVKSVHMSTPSAEKRPNKRKYKPQNETDPETAAFHESNVICNHCGRHFNTVLGLNVHRFRSHGIRISQNPLATANDELPPQPPPITIKIKKKKKSFELANAVSNSDNGVSKCKLCYDEFSDARSLAEHGYLHVQEGFLLCMLCSNMTFTNKIALSRHLEQHSLNTAYPAHCIYCQHLLTSRTEAAVHWRGEHGLSSFQCPHCETRYLYHKSLSRHIREVHPELRHAAAVHTAQRSEEAEKCNETVVLQETKEAESEPTVETVEDVPAVEESVEETTAIASFEFKCAKCDFGCQTRCEFRAHIVQHKSPAGETFQCPECGISYVVEPSLHKHLILVHKVKDFESYFESLKSDANGGSDSDVSCVNNNNCLEDVLSNGNGESESLRCNICFSSFDNEQLLKTHSRSHGMAFLQASTKRTFSASDSSPNSTPVKEADKSFDN